MDSSSDQNTDFNLEIHNEAINHGPTYRSYRIFDKVQSGLSHSSLKRFLFNAALSSKENELRRGIIRNNTIWDKLVLGKVQESMGGRIRLLVVGSAPLAGSVLTFMRCALGCVIVEGYGQTECVAPATLTVQVPTNFNLTSPQLTSPHLRQGPSERGSWKTSIKLSQTVTVIIVITFHMKQSISDL